MPLDTLPLSLSKKRKTEEELIPPGKSMTMRHNKTHTTTEFNIMSLQSSLLHLEAMLEMSTDWQKQ